MLIVHYPIVNRNGTELNLTVYTDTVQIDYYRNYVVYSLPGSRKFENNEKIPGTGKLFVYKRGEQFGYLLKDRNAMNRVKLRVDSFLQARAFAGARFYAGPNDSLVQRSISKGGAIVEEGYAPIRKYNESIFDTMYFSYSKDLRDVPYSLSPALDSLRGMKLCKVRLIYVKGFSKEYQIELPRREFVFELLRGRGDHDREITGLLKGLDH